MTQTTETQKELKASDGDFRFLVRVVCFGDNRSWGGIHREFDPIVEFYDRDYDFTVRGQFVSDYYLSTLLAKPRSEGINLHGGVPKWTIRRNAYSLVDAFLRGDFNKFNGEKDS